MSERLFRRPESAVWYCWVYDLAGRRHKISTKCTDKRAALAKLRDLERQATGSSHASPGNAYALKTALAYLLNNDTTGRSQATLDMYQVKGGQLMRVLGGTFDLAAIRLDDVQAYIATRLSERSHDDPDDTRTVSRSTVQKEIVTLRRVLTLARDRGLLKVDPRAIIPEFRVRYVPRERYLTEAEFSKLEGQLEPARRLWVQIAVYAGARHSEVEALTWGDVHLKKPATILLPGTKTAKARRRIPLAEPLRRALEAAKGAHGAVVEPWGNVRRDLAVACKAVKLEPVTPNDLRRTFASWLKQRGIDSMTVAKLMGHTTSRMVELVYGRLNDRVYADAMATLGKGRGRR